MEGVQSIIHQDDEVAVFVGADGAHRIRYDAGAHQIAMREDAIGVDEADAIRRDPGAITRVMFALQRRLKASGQNPYAPNTAADEGR